MADTRLTWADVAHYYTNLQCVSEGNRFVAIGFTTKDNPKPSNAYYHVGSLGVSLCDNYLPVLRAYEDMTETEAREILTLSEKFDIEPLWEEETAKDTIFRYDHMDHLSATHLERILGCPQMLHWLVSSGFNVFDLEWETEAIRKEATE